jgi:hypothetical protein
MKKCVNVIFTGEWNNYHRKNFINSVMNELNSWSDTVILQNPLSLLFHTFAKFRIRFISYLKGEFKINEIEKGKYIFTPIILFHHNLWLKFQLLGLIDSLLIKIQFELFLKRIVHDKKIILWVYIPQHKFIIRFLKYDFLVYDSYDDNELDFYGYEIAKYISANKILIEKANLIITVAKYTYEKFKKFTDKVIYLPNGNSFNLLKRNNLVEKANEIIDLNGPIIGYLGNIRDWIDFALIRYLLNKYPDYYIVFIGSILRSAKKDMKELKKKKNFIYINFQQIENIPRYLNYFNVGIIPFKINDFMLSVFPNKFFEYMAAEIPVVTNALPEMEKYSDYIGYAKNNEEFALFCEQAINGEFDEKVKKYQDLAVRNDWGERAKVINSELLNIVNKK